MIKIWLRDKQHGLDLVEDIYRDLRKIVDDYERNDFEHMGDIIYEVTDILDNIAISTSEEIHESLDKLAAKERKDE